MPVPLPSGTRLVHIGPQKTGTSSLQEAFHSARDRLEALGVHYAGERRQQRVAAGAVVKGRALAGNSPDTVDRWPQLVQEVREAAAARVVISAEMFAGAKDPQAREIVAAFEPGVHVVVTLRPLVRILPSQWQQYVQNDIVTSYADWLEEILNHPDERRVTPSFWLRHRHDRLVARWADIVGPDRVTVVALDENDHGTSFRAFERLLDLPEGTLVPGTRSNRSLTLPEIEVVRAINMRYKQEGWSKDLYEKVVHEAFHNGLKAREPDPSEPRIETPRWAQERADAIAGDIVAGLEKLQADGVQVLGDLATLRLEPSGPEAAPTVDAVSLDLVGAAAIELVRASVITPKDAVRRLVYGGSTDLRRASVSQVANEMAGRVRRRLRRSRTD